MTAIWSMALLLAGVATIVSADELIAARCQAKCLKELEQRYKDQPDMRKQLRHETLTLCKNDHNCSSCTLPCKESIDTTQRCTLNFCKPAIIQRACADSCVFLEKISRKKPGQCPKQELFSADECSAECNRDSDCAETEKCCTLGCSRICSTPASLDEPKLLPIPEGISVAERKRKRSAVIRWIMKKMSPQHTSTSSNLFVIQWRWGVTKDPAEMTPWQTIMVKNKMYAILKHLLSPGRFYIFRVASINVHGSAGFSQPSLPFKLTKEVRAPLPPFNLTVTSELYDENTNSWTIEIGWTPPSSELPLKDYLLTWWKSTVDGADAYEKQMVGQKAALVQRRRNLDDDLDDEEETVEEEAEGVAAGDRRSAVLSSYTQRAALDARLEPESVYVVELAANVDSTEGELRGEPAVLVIRTKSKPLPTTTPWSYDPIGRVPDMEIERLPSEKRQPKSDEKPGEPDGMKLTEAMSTFRAELQAPYFSAGMLRSTVSWLDHSRCTPLKREFKVRMRSLRCPQHTTSEQLVNECVANLDDLQFGCDYVVEVLDSENNELLTRVSFTTPICSRTPSVEPIDCQLFQKHITEQPLISCLPSNRDETNAVECEWSMGNTAEADTVGFRAVLHSSKQPDAKISIVPANVHRLRFGELTAGTDYRLQVQAVTSNGLGAEVMTQFRTGAAGVFLVQEIDPNRQELSLEATSSSAPPRTSLSLLLIALILVCRRI